jgi:hypothetical protein
VLVTLGHFLGILPIALYLAGVAFLAASAKNLSLKARIALMVALPTMHFAWGTGFWRGYLVGAKGKLDSSRLGKQ